MVWVGRDLKDTVVQTPCHGQGPLPPAQAAQSTIQPGLELQFQGEGSHSSSGQLGQCLTALRVKNFFLISNVNLLYQNIFVLMVRIISFQIPAKICSLSIYTQ